MLSTLLTDSNIWAAVSATTAATQSDGNDVENGPQREDGYALSTGNAVGVFALCTSVSWAANLAPGRRTLPTTFEWQPLSNAFPILSDYHRRAATGLAAYRHPWFDTSQIREMPRGKFTCGCRGRGHMLEDC